MLGINNILNPRKLFHVVMTLQHPRWVRKLVKEANCGAVVLLTGLGIISISSVVWKSPIIWSLPLLFSHTAPPAVLGMQCFLWTHGWPISLPGLLPAAPPSSGGCSLLAHLSQLAYSYSLAFPQESLKKVSLPHTATVPYTSPL